MRTAYDTLKIEYNRCPSDCRLCEEACAKEKGEGVTSLSRIKPIHIPQAKFHGALTCIQCGQPKCVQICPAGAIEKNPEDGIVRIDEDKCVGCGLCTVACPYGGIYYNLQSQKPFKCDQCDGEPKCAEVCPCQAITYIKNSPVIGYLRHEDVVPPGVGACRGCPAELAVRFTFRILGDDSVIFTAPGCAVTFLCGFGTQAGIRLADFHCLLTNVASSMTGVYRHYKSIGRKVKLVAFVGDGATVDIGFQALSGAAERGENFIYICYDNEGYMNTGVQRSGSTPLAAATTTTPVGPTHHGKEQAAKNLPLLMLFHEIPYVATASVSHLEDYAKKLSKASNVSDGLAYIHLFSPCPTGWGIQENRGIDVARLAVETNYFPLWEAEYGEVRITEEVASPKPIHEYTDLLGKYSHLTKKEQDQLQESVYDRYEMIKLLTLRHRRPKRQKGNLSAI
ncbi:4Fe-4S dicluster domain-containing protein [Bacteroidota bacterium]